MSQTLEWGKSSRKQSAVVTVSRSHLLLSLIFGSDWQLSFLTCFSPPFLINLSLFKLTHFLSEEEKQYVAVPGFTTL
jgi:hypothetical protein